MKNILSIFCLALLLTSTAGIAAGSGDFLFSQSEDSKHIIVNNRILATVNGKHISVVDIMKKMDVLFYKQYPEYTSSTVARFQYYKLNWKQVLEDLVDKEMVLADAEEAKLPIANGDIRQEMEMSFGPNIVMNLDKAGLTFDEAWKMMKNDILLKRMVHYRANARAIRQVTPQDIRKAYEEYSKDHILPEKWEYTVVSIRDNDVARGAETANLAHQLLVQQTAKLENLIDEIKASNNVAEEIKISVSDAFSHTEKELSPAYLDVLANMNAETFSQPVAQKGRDKNTVYRIFYLKKHTQAGPPLFQDVANNLKEVLLDVAVEKETMAYLNKLREHYHVQESGELQMLLSEGFEPFILR